MLKHGIHIYINIPPIDKKYGKYGLIHTHLGHGCCCMRVQLHLSILVTADILWLIARSTAAPCWSLSCTWLWWTPSCTTALQDLPVKLFCTSSNLSTLNHMDFVWGMDAKTFVYEDLMDNLEWCALHMQNVELSIEINISQNCFVNFSSKTSETVVSWINIISISIQMGIYQQN